MTTFDGPEMVLLAILALVLVVAALSIKAADHPPQPDPPCSNIVICYGDPYLGRA